MPPLRLQVPIYWAILNLRELGADVLWARGHKAHVQQQLAGILSRRLRLVATIWLLLSIAWLPVDLLTLPTQSWPAFVGTRLVTIAGLAFLAQRPFTRELPRIRWYLALFFAIQAISDLPAIALDPDADRSWLEVVIHAAYDDLPFVLIAAIGLFPLFLVDAVAIALGMIAVSLAIGLAQHFRGIEVFDPASLWLLALVGTLSALSAAAQMEAIVHQVVRAGRDPLTNALPRRVGEEVLAAEAGVALRHKSPLTVIFLDLDHFKTVNDSFGHDAGDAVLRKAAKNLHRALRNQDSLIRWGGEEFVIVLPLTDLAGTRQFLVRLAEIGLGTRPDSSPLTASLGVAELGEVASDARAGWPELVALADRRMYEAKQAGRNQVAMRDGKHPFLVSRASPDEMGSASARSYAQG